MEGLQDQNELETSHDYEEGDYDQYGENLDAEFSVGMLKKAEESVLAVLKQGHTSLDQLSHLKLKNLALLSGSQAAAAEEQAEDADDHEPKTLSGRILTVMWDTVTEINISHNELISLEGLSNFKVLRYLNASFNFLTEANLNLPRLEELHLESNHISKFPLLNQLHRIRILNLNANRIEAFKVEFRPPSCLSLQQLDIGQNRIEFASNNDFYLEFLEKMKKLKNLKVLVIDGNPFMSSGAGSDQKKLELIVASVPTLEWINGEKAEGFRSLKPAGASKAKEDDQSAKGGKPAAQAQKSGPGKQKKGADINNVYIPTLETLCFNLEAANSHPTFALEHLRDLAFDVEKLSDHLDLIDEYFAIGKNDVQINDMIEDFMQNSQVLINNHFELQHIMLTILSKLSIVKFYEFGVRCFNTLKDLMNAGKEMEERVISIIRKEVVQKLHQQQNPEAVPASLLQGLFELVKQTGKSEMLTGLYENCFPQWLRLLNTRVQACKRLVTIYPDNPHFDAVMALMSVSLSGSEEGASRKNAEIAREKELGPIVADILLETTWEQTRYLHCLKIAELLSLSSQEAANGFFEKSLQNSMLKNVKQAINFYKKWNDLKADDSSETEAHVKLRYLTLAAEINCLGGLLEARIELRKDIVYDPLIEDLLMITSHYKTDPVLLTAICKFARQLFSREEVRTRQEYLSSKVKKMQNLVQLVPYLGMKKYEELLKMSRRYYDASAFAEREKATQLQHLDDIVVHELFIAIVNLMNLFCEEAEKTGSCAIFLEACQSLNDASREAGLFNCLEVPNDDVKLAVVECLNNVPLEEFDSEEVATIIRLVGSCKNIGAGKTELVLAKIFWILTKLTKDTEEESGRNFRIKFGEKAVGEALEIMLRNQARALDDPDEEQEKLSLSLSCLHFLKYISMNQDTKKYLLNRHDQFKRALFLDERCTSYDCSKIPVEVEETWLGRNMDVLLFAISGGGGSESVTPYTSVSFRLLQRMADVLMNRNVEEISDCTNPFFPGIHVIDHLTMHYRDKLKTRKARERSYWPEPNEHMLNRIKESQGSAHDSQIFATFYKQHYWFTSNNGIPLLRMFLTKKVAACEQWLKKEFDPGYDKHSLVVERVLHKARKKAEDKEMEHRKREDELRSKALAAPTKRDRTTTEEEGKEPEEGRGIQVLKEALQKEELGQHFNAGADYMASSAKGRLAKVENIKKRDFKMGGVQNLKLRGLCIAAYLRCLYGAIEYAPTEQLRLEAINQLQDIYVFRNLTQLCDTTGWFEANIGAKYLRVMRHVIKVPLTQATEASERLAHYEIVSKAVRKMLEQLSVKLKNEQQKPLCLEDKALIFELASICNLICAQSANMFRWSQVLVRQQGAHARTRRHPQEKVVDRQISLLFPAQSILTFIAIVFRDMDVASKVFVEGASESTAAKEPRVIRLRNQLARENIRQFLGTYLSKCKDYKYDVLEAFMKGVVFEKKKLRESFLQEILKASVESGYRTSIEDFLLDQKMVIDAGVRERIVLMSWVEAAAGTSVQHIPKLFLMTNKGVHILKPPAGKPCSVCPMENLCPSGPRADLKYKYESLVEIVTFPDLPQKLLLKFSRAKQENPQADSETRKEATLDVCLILPTLSGARDALRLLQEVTTLFHPRTKVEITQDFMLRCGGLQRKVTKEDSEAQLQLAIFASHNVRSGFFGLGGAGDAVIPGCSLLVLTNTEMIVLRENWVKWTQSRDRGYIESVLEKMVGPEDKGQIQTKAQREQEDRIKAAIEDVYTEVVRYKLDDIENLHVHKGKDSVVDIEFQKGKTEKLTFLCDYGRQEFILTLVGIKNGSADQEENDQY